MADHATESVSIDDLIQWDLTHFWHSFTQMQTYHPFIVERGEGCWLFDINGRKILDGVSSLWCNVHGHQREEIDRAVIDQLNRVAHVTSLGASCDTTIKLARKLAEISPGDLNHVFFSSDGACAVEVALKMAFQYWRQIDAPQPERNLFLALGNAYHGDTIGTVSVGGIDQFHALFQPLLFDVVRIPSPDCYRLPPGVKEENALDHFVTEYRRILAENHDRVAAIVMEPLVQGAAGIVRHPAGLLARTRELADEFGTLLIADEVAVGMGRTGKMFACEHESVVPDILCIGKGLSGGYLPMSATIAGEKIFDAFKGQHHGRRTLFHGHTYSGNPLAAAASIENLNLFESDQTLEKMRPKITHMERRLGALRQHVHVGDVRQCGLMAGVELVSDKSNKEPFPVDLEVGRNVCREALDRDVWLRPLGDVIVIIPPLVISEQELDFLFDGLEQAIDAGIASAGIAKVLDG